jgi:DNA/RNA endonuclease YhcR with UshA esterase domain
MQNRIVFFCFFLIASVGYAFGQASQGMAYGYDPATETTVTGAVEQVNHPQYPNRMIGTHVDLKTDAGVFDVHIGPESFITKQGFSFEKGDTLTVTGSKQVLGGKDSIIAREIKKGDQVLTLRSVNGIPKWSRRGATTN